VSAQTAGGGRMKLIYCPECTDIVSMAVGSRRKCRCGMAWGMVEDSDHLRAAIGGTAIAIGFGNTSFRAAISARPQHGRGVPFDAFVIPEYASTVRRVK